MKDLVYFELNNWFAGRDYPDKEPINKWVKTYQFSDEEWCKENKLVVLEGSVDMSINWCIIATKEWIKENCPFLLENESYNVKFLVHSHEGTKEEIREYNMSHFLRYPNEDNEVYGQFGWLFPEYTEENFGIGWVDEDED